MLPQGIRIRLGDRASAGATALELPDRRMWPVGLVFAAMFALFAGVEWTVISNIAVHSVRNVSDLVFVLFQAFWALGWSVGVITLGAITVFLCFYRESARLQDSRLVYVPRLGPLSIIVEYELGRIRNVRLERADSDDKARVRFDYNLQSNTLGDTMPRNDAAILVGKIQSAVAAAPTLETMPPDPSPTVRLKPDTTKTEGVSSEAASLAVLSPSGLALIAANLVPLGGVLFFSWSVSTIMILFWAESAVIGFYTALKMIVVGKFWAIFAVPFFIGHFGGFMAGHFLFIYGFFVRGLGLTGPEPDVRETLSAVFLPLWTSLAALFISHGVSFFTNFIGRREYKGTSVQKLMAAPYNRIIVMQLTLILGGWFIMLLNDPVPVLALLVVLKTGVDFMAHRKEHRGDTY